MVRDITINVPDSVEGGFFPRRVFVKPGQGSGPQPLIMSYHGAGGNPNGSGGKNQLLRMQAQVGGTPYIWVGPSTDGTAKPRTDLSVPPPPGTVPSWESALTTRPHRELDLVKEIIGIIGPAWNGELYVCGFSAGGSQALDWLRHAAEDPVIAAALKGIACLSNLPPTVYLELPEVQGLVPDVKVYQINSIDDGNNMWPNLPPKPVSTNASRPELYDHLAMRTGANLGNVQSTFAVPQTGQWSGADTVFKVYGPDGRLMTGEGSKWQHCVPEPNECGGFDSMEIAMNHWGLPTA